MSAFRKPNRRPPPPRMVFEVEAIALGQLNTESGDLVQVGHIAVMLDSDGRGHWLSPHGDDR